jgi:hypothetical protein
MDIEKIRTMAIEPIVHSYDKRDTILYALGLGYGADPLCEAELPFVYEKDLVCLPTCSVTPASGLRIHNTR